MKFIVLITSICALFLLLTRASVGERAELSNHTINSIFAITGHAAVANTTDALRLFNSMFVRHSSGRIKLWQSLQKSDLWACEATGAGMWAEITLAFVFDTSKNCIVGMRVIDQNETAGLGDRIIEDFFFEQFDELAAHSGIAMAPTRTRSNQFDAVSGATITSRSIETIINRSLRHLREAVRETARKKGAS